VQWTIVAEHDRAVLYCYVVIAMLMLSVCVVFEFIVVILRVSCEYKYVKHIITKIQSNKLYCIRLKSMYYFKIESLLDLRQKRIKKSKLSTLSTGHAFFVFAVK
jgi:hypothetical protein